MIYRYIYSIGKFSWLCEIPFTVTLNNESEEFLSLSNLKAEYDRQTEMKHVIFKEVDALSPMPDNIFPIKDRYFITYKNEKIMYRAYWPGGEPYAEVHFYSDQNILCKYVPSAYNELKYAARMLDHLSIEYLFLPNKGFILHSCLIRYQGNAILFSAPSGTGKSTQGDLWVKFRGAEVLNGDRSGVFYDEDHWSACGLPYAGSSLIYRNETAPVKAIVYLAQGPENEIKRLTAIQAFPLLYEQILIHHWEPDFVNQISDILLKLMDSVPVYYLSCRPDEGAVEALEQELNKL